MGNITFNQDGQMSNKDQIDYWNGPGGEKWVTHADRLDGLLAPFAEAVLDQAQLQSGESVLDIGCGAGALSLQAKLVKCAGCAASMFHARSSVSHRKELPYRERRQSLRSPMQARIAPRIRSTL